MIDAEAQSEGMAEEKLDMYMQQGVNNKMGLNAQTAAKLDAHIQNKWGFIRNIININTFFSNGTATDVSKGTKSLLDDEKVAKQKETTESADLWDEEKDLSKEFKQKDEEDNNDDDSEEQAAPRKKRVKHYRVSKDRKKKTWQPVIYEGETSSQHQAQ